ncbi:MAG: hypothetical protein MO853_13650 [Candidatus Protistobacter heckmanni]|nr:hypothetical protein [Candidatus Protistobacter heckmanni]
MHEVDALDHQIRDAMSLGGEEPINDHEHLATLQGYYAEHRVLPSYARLMSLLGYASKSAVKKVLERLERVGHARANARRGLGAQ